MPRIEQTLGEITSATGEGRPSAGPSGAGPNRNTPRNPKSSNLTRGPLKGCTCKNCKGSGCVFYGRS